MPDTIGLYAPTRTQGEFKALKIDETTAGTTYFGFARIGSATNAPVWQIKRLVEASSITTMTWADSNAEFDNIWDNRASYIYG